MSKFKSLWLNWLDDGSSWSRQESRIMKTAVLITVATWPVVYLAAVGGTMIPWMILYPLWPN